MAACFWWSNPPSIIVILPGWTFRRSPMIWSSSIRPAGAQYVRNCSAWRFQSWIAPSAQYLMMAWVSLYLSCAYHPRSPKISVSALDMASLDRGGKMYWSVVTVSMIAFQIRSVAGIIPFILLLQAGLGG